MTRAAAVSLPPRFFKRSNRLMIRYILRRLLLIIPVLLGAIIVVFTINYFSTTDPAMVKLGLSASDPYKLAAMREQMGLNRPSTPRPCGSCWPGASPTP